MTMRISIFAICVSFLLAPIKASAERGPGAESIRHYLDPAKIEHYEDFAYVYKMHPCWDLQAYKRLGFHNWMKFYDNGGPKPHIELMDDSELSEIRRRILRTKPPE